MRFPVKVWKRSLQGGTMKVVSPGYLKENHIEISDQRIETITRQGKTVVFLLEDERPVGVTRAR